MLNRSVRSCSTDIPKDAISEQCVYLEIGKDAFKYRNKNNLTL